MTVLRDDKSRLTIGAPDGSLMAESVSGDLRIRVGGLVGGTETRIDRDDAVALRDWINAALTSGAIR